VRDHASLDVLERAAYFFAGVEYIERVEDLFYFCEELDHSFAIHHLEVRCADDAVVVLAGDRALVFGDQLVDLGREIEDVLAAFWV